MGLITPEYMELQKELHARGGYGIGADADECARLVRLCGASGSVLDYGCGQGALKPLLPEYDVREYDPCIEGKDGPPEPADYVVCADVLEHIEEDCIHNVIAHIRTLTRKRAILVIATGPSRKTLADGRNAHILLRDAGWWRELLYPLFHLERFDDRSRDGKGLLAILEPVVVIEKVNAFGVLSEKKRNKNTAINVKLTRQRIPTRPQPVNSKLLIIACYGPSIRDTLPVLKQVHATAQELAKLGRGGGAEIVSVSGAHDFLLQNGVRPDFHVECDPRKHKSDMLAQPRKGIKYLMASCCHPGLIRRLKDYDLTLWHQLGGEESYAIRDIPSEKIQAVIPGGGSVALRALPLFYFLGYRNFMVHGFDCSFAADGTTHAGPHANPKENNELWVRVDGTDKLFRTTPVMISYSNQLLKDIQGNHFPGTQFWFQGEGLFQARLADCQRRPVIELPPGWGQDYFGIHKTTENAA